VNLIAIKYQFDFSDGRQRVYDIQLDAQKILFQSKRTTPLPAWTKLENSQCSHCPLVAATSPHCPIAANLADLVEAFSDEISHTKTKVTVTTDERQYIKETDVQTGLYGIVGIIMATSGCPKMNFLKPMARFHLPFSTADETIMRSIGFYLIRQFVEKKSGADFDVELKGLDQHYADIQKVNQGIAARFKNIIKSGDASRNTVTTLDCFSKLLSMALGRNLEKFKSLFADA
jgi:hypothetical protein